MEVTSSLLTKTWDKAVQSCDCFMDAYEQCRDRCVRTITRDMPFRLAYCIDKISKTVPEIFVTLCSLSGIGVVPALFVALGRKAYPILPVCKVLLRPDIDLEELKARILEARQVWNDVFDDVIVPALFVCLTIESVYAFTAGYLLQDWNRLLYGTSIALPAALLAYRSMMCQADIAAKHVS